MFLLIAGTMTNLMVQSFMTPPALCIQHDQSLVVAYTLMRDHGAQHLPVLKQGRLAGIVSLRDLYMIGSLEHRDMVHVPVIDVMSTFVYAVGPRTSIRKIAAEMTSHHYEAAVVVDGDAVLGIFTLADALQALNSVLGALLHAPAAVVNVG